MAGDDKTIVIHVRGVNLGEPDEETSVAPSTTPSPHPPMGIWSSCFLACAFCTASGFGLLAIILGLFLLYALPVATIIIGALHLNPESCPIETRIGTLLVVGGAFSIVNISVRAAVLLNSKRTDPSWGLYESMIQLLITVSDIAWMLVASVLVYKIWPHVDYLAKGSKNYCDKTLYLYAFIYLTICWILMGLILLYTFLKAVWNNLKCFAEEHEDF